MNSGHLPWEIDVEGLRTDKSVAAVDEVVDGITTLHLQDGRAVHLLTHGHMVNLAGPRPLGNSIESMDLGSRSRRARSRRSRPGRARLVLRRAGPGRHRRPGGLRVRGPGAPRLAARPAPTQYWKSSSRYFGSGQRSSATSVSSSSATSRSAAWAGMTDVDERLRLVLDATRLVGLVLGVLERRDGVDERVGEIRDASGRSASMPRRRRRARELAEVARPPPAGSSSRRCRGRSWPRCSRP